MSGACKLSASEADTLQQLVRQSFKIVVNFKTNDEILKVSWTCECVSVCAVMLWYT